MTMTLQDLFLTEDNGDMLPGELQETLEARWSRVRHDLTGQGFMLDASTIDELWNPWFHLIEEHYDPSRVRLTSTDRRRLGRLQRALTETLKALGPDLRETAHCIGGWVEGTLIPHCGDLASWTSATALIKMEIADRLNEPTRHPGRPRDRILRRFAVDVGCVLADADEPVRASRRGLFAKVLSRLITEAELPLPREVFRMVSEAVKALPKERRRRGEDKARFAEIRRIPSNLRA